MAIPSVKFTFPSCKSVVIILLLLNVTTKGQGIDSLVLKNYFEEALVNCSKSLWSLQQVYFDPSQFISPEKICLTVSVTLHNITYSEPNGSVPCIGFSSSPAFQFCDNPDSSGCTNGSWYFRSTYQLNLVNDQSGGDSSQLSSLLTSSGIYHWCVLYI